MDALITITQPALLRCQKVRDHDRLAIVFGLWCWSAGLLSSHDLAAIVLIKGGLIVHDEDELEEKAIRHRKSVWVWEFTSAIIPMMKGRVVSPPSLDKHTSILHNVLSFMSINIHSISSALVSPIKLLQPAACCSYWNRWLANAFLREGLLHLRTCDKIGNVLWLDKPLL